MAAAGKTYGFGRVSAHTRPSPYSLVELRGTPVGTHAPHANRALGRRLRVRLITVAAVLLAAALAAASLIGFRPSGEPAPKPAMEKPPAAPQLSDEARRLVRSAIAVARYTPRP